MDYRAFYPLTKKCCLTSFIVNPFQVPAAVLGRPRSELETLELAAFRYSRTAGGKTSNAVQEVEHDVLVVRGGSGAVLTSPRQEHHRNV